MSMTMKRRGVSRTGGTVADQEDDDDNEYLCVGDHICLFSQQAQGYVFSDLTTSSMNMLYTYEDQDITRPSGIHNPHVVTFRIHVQNRYKLNRIVLGLQDQLVDNPLHGDLMVQIEQAKKAAENEHRDNMAEQRRLHGKIIKYGDIIQLNHTFSKKYIHSCPQKQSEREQGSFLAYLDESNSKSAQFRVLPKYKLNTEGDDFRSPYTDNGMTAEFGKPRKTSIDFQLICCGDHIVLESLKSPGHFLHSTEPFTYYNTGKRCELNCSVNMDGFTVIKRFETRESDESDLTPGLWGGAVLQLHHKHLEAYVCADVTTGDAKPDCVYLHVQEADPARPETLYPPQSSATFWQVLPEFSSIDGEPLYWGSQVRLQHFTAHRYLCVDSDNNLGLTDDSSNVRAVFRLHHMQRHGLDTSARARSTDSFGYVGDNMLARIEHVISGTWLHGVNESKLCPIENIFQPGKPCVKKVAVSPDQLYYDAFCLQRISSDQLFDTNLVLGISPLISLALYQLQENKEMNEDQILEVTLALGQLKDFLQQPVDEKRMKTRKTLVREQKIIDQLVTLLQLVMSQDKRLELTHLIHSISQLFMACIHSDKDNCMYVTQFMDFFQSHITMKDGNPLGVSMIQILLELIHDRRDVIDTVTEKQIDKIVFYFRKYQHYRYLKVLSSLCCCDGQAIAQNQTYIARQILNKSKTCLFNFVIHDNKVCLWTAKMKEPTPISAFIKETGKTHLEDDLMLLSEELQLFDNLCKGRNQYCVDVLTKEQCFVTWEVAFSVLKATDIPAAIRALFCQLVITLYVDISENAQLQDSCSYTYVYNKLDLNKPPEIWFDQQTQFVDRSLDIKVPKLQQWLYSFLCDNIVLSPYNEYHELVLLTWVLIFHLIEFGYYSLSKIQELIPIMIRILQTKYDTQGKESPHIPDDNSVEASIEIRYSVLLVLELVLELQFKYKVEMFVATYKDIETRELSSGKHKTPLVDFLHEVQGKVSLFNWTSPKTELRKTLENIIRLSPIPLQNLDKILMDLARDARNLTTEYVQDQVRGDACDKITIKALLLLRNYFLRRSRLQQAGQDAMILVAEESSTILQDAQTFMPLLTRLLSVRVDEDQCQIICAILDKFKSCCVYFDAAQTLKRPNATGQKILINQGILEVSIKFLKNKNLHLKYKKDKLLIDQVVRYVLQLLSYLCVDNQAVQGHLYAHLDELLHVTYAPKTLANTLKMVFKDNPALCDKVDGHAVQQIVQLSIRHNTRAPDFLQVLSTLMLPHHDSDRINTRQQHLISKLHRDFHAQIEFQLLNMSAHEKQLVLLGDHGQDRLTYFINIANVVSLISKDMKESIQSACSSAFSLKDVLVILGHPDISCNLKRPFLKLFSWVLLPQKEHAIHTKWFWTFMELVSIELDKIYSFSKEDGIPIIDHVEDSFMPTADTDKSTIIASNIYFFIDSVLPFLKKFSYKYASTSLHNPKHLSIYRRIVTTAISCFPVIVASMDNTVFLQTICSSLNAMMRSSSYGEGAIADILDIINNNFAKRHPGRLRNDEENLLIQREYDLNSKLKIFVQNCKKLNVPINTIEKQLGIKEKKYAKLAYTELGSGKQLPLSDEFQEHTRAFISRDQTSTDARYEHVIILIRQLQIVANTIDNTTVENQILAHSSIQILRAHLHNIIILLPADIFTSKTKKKKYRIRVEQLQDLQNLYVSHGLVHLVMTLIGTQNQAIFRESLALLECMLFGASSNVQNSALEFFETTREEALFMIISDFLKYSANLMKERRYITQQTQVQDQKEEQVPQKQPKKGLYLNFKPPKKLARIGVEDTVKSGKTPPVVTATPTQPCCLQEKLLKVNTCTVQLILKVVAKLAEGHHTGLQNYLREQPDNLRSYNIIATVTQYLGHMYMAIRNDNIKLTVDIFRTLREMCLGNQQNRLVILDNKIVDYVNLIMKQSSFDACCTEDTLELKRNVCSLLISLVEESNHTGLDVAKIIAETLDIEAVLSTLRYCHENMELPLAADVGHQMYIVYAKMMDVMTKPSDDVQKLGGKYKAAVALYREKVHSVEIIKDGHLHKVYFSIVNKHDVRADLKQNLKWNVDRTSTTNKILDFIQWARVIIKDYYYQERMLSFCLSKAIVKYRKVWDSLLILLSLIINLYMLSCWVGPAVEPQSSSYNQTVQPHVLYIAKPEVRINISYYRYILWAGMALHNLMTLIVLISYLLSQHPSLPRCHRRNTDKSPWVDEDGLDSKRQNHNAKMFSARTAYYLVLFILSIVGSTLSEYAFAFHLLHLIEVNALLHGVIKAITKNGKSLLWVGILGAVVLYIYGLVGFAFFRHIFEPNSQLHCATLYECTATVTTYGLIGLLGETVTLHSEDTFIIFVCWSVYQITFFILFTTIGLNIIFGIIVDTFSELRDLKWRAEKDMQDVCFICGLPSYHFEHHTKGFYHHTHHEHNMWTYIYYFIYLSTTNRSEYTALDYYVADQRRRGLSGYFPVNRALSLVSQEEDAVDKLEELRRDIAFLKQRQQQQDVERHLHDQNKDQKQWRRAVAKRKSQHIFERMGTAEKETTSATKHDDTDGTKPDADGTDVAKP